MSVLDKLYDSISRRLRPEDVAELVRLEIGAKLTKVEARLLDQAACGALTRRPNAFSSMSIEFHRPIGLACQVSTARELFVAVASPSEVECDQPEILSPYLETLARTIAKTVGASDFKAHRLNREHRSAVGLGELSKRQYNKRFRLLGRMEAKLKTLEREIRKREFTLVAKSRLASKLSRDEFLTDADTACFVAYLTARANLRSVFTNGPQDRAYDEIAEMLLERCQRNSSTNWWAIAHIHTDRDVLLRLTDEQKGRFLALWFELLQGIATLLQEVWEYSRFNRSTMIVKRGDDSTTWNATAGSWNKARSGWIAVLQALQMDDLLDRLCPGKVLRLMAADVAAWHRSSGGGLDPDTAVWAALPAPWEVFNGTAICTRTDVEAACLLHSVDPILKGWTASSPNRTVESYRLTPELVHGVEIGDSRLATLLRKLGFFSGKTKKNPTL